MSYTNQRKGARSLPWLLAGIGLLVCPTAFTLATLHADPAKSSQVTGMTHANSVNDSSTLQSGLQGIPSITPHLNLAANAASVASGVAATLPTFTADDASAWVTANWLPAFHGTATIGSVTFVPQKQANQWANVGLGLGLPVGAPVCVVVLDGNITDPMRLPGVTPPTTTYSYTILGFNGVTGNLLDRGLTNSLPAALAAPATPTTDTSTPTTGTYTPLTNQPIIQLEGSMPFQLLSFTNAVDMACCARARSANLELRRVFNYRGDFHRAHYDCLCTKAMPALLQVSLLT